MKSKVNLSVFLVVALLSISPFLMHAQKLQLKKGIISADKEQVGKLEGSAPLLKPAPLLKIKSLNDQDLIIIQEKWVYYGSHFILFTPIYVLDFVPLGKRGVLKLKNGHISSEKNILKYLSDNIGEGFIKSSGLNTELVEDFLVKRNDAEVVGKDTLHIKAFIEAAKERYKDKIQSTGAISFKETSFDYLGAPTNENDKADLKYYDILAGKKVIGRLVKDTEVSFTTKAIESESFLVFRKVEPFKIDGIEYQFIPVALYEIGALTNGTMAIKDEKRYQEKIGTLGGGAERELIPYLQQLEML